ncbi:hypothetical protein VP01_1154g2 [Puccinia sorghi]|uniref:Uncharacterized protein n=1 Tax=Puccinia sorghi TaxID=27349 RepID=A0A0L6VRX1_9BASI|nr:hypothetical protein VP01_1154g2 [Puccinia sorghi]
MGVQEHEGGFWKFLEIHCGPLIDNPSMTTIFIEDCCGFPFVLKFQKHQEFLKLNVNYWTYTGILNYLACRTQPDLASAVSLLSRFNQRPWISHWKEMLHCLKYLKGTQDLDLLLKPDVNSLSRHKPESCRVVPLHSGNQKNITLSSTESKMNALSDGEQENQWLTFLLEELWKQKLDPTVFHVDNCGLMEKLKHFGLNSKMKHLDIKIKNLRDKFMKQEI